MDVVGPTAGHTHCRVPCFHPRALPAGSLMHTLLPPPQLPPLMQQTFSFDHLLQYTLLPLVQPEPFASREVGCRDCRCSHIMAITRPSAVGPPPAPLTCTSLASKPSLKPKGVNPSKPSQLPGLLPDPPSFHPLSPWLGAISYPLSFLGTPLTLVWHLRLQGVLITDAPLLPPLLHHGACLGLA